MSMKRLTKYGKTSHENGVCCTHFNSKECNEVAGNCAYNCKWEEAAWSKLAAYEDAEEQGLLLKFPYKIGSTVYAITTCKDIAKVLDGTLWDEGGGFGTATGYYCPYELNNSCPHEDDFDECEGGCECFENKLGVFEDFVEGIAVYEDGTYVFLEKHGSFSCEDFGRIIFLTMEEAEAALAEMEG